MQTNTQGVDIPKVGNQPGPAKKAPVDRDDAALREHERVLYVARQNQDERVNTDLLAALIIIVALGLLAFGAWALWAYVLSQPVHHG